VLFVGTFEHTIDAKNRLAIPSEVRDQFGEGLAFYPMLIEGPTLALYTPEGFERRGDELEDSDWTEEEILAYERLQYSISARLEMDKQGRIRVPDRLLKLCNLNRDVMIVGSKDHLEIHNRDSWNEQFDALMKRSELLVNPRKVGRNRRSRGREQAV